MNSILKLTVALAAIVLAGCSGTSEAPETALATWRSADGSTALSVYPTRTHARWDGGESDIPTFIQNGVVYRHVMSDYFGQPSMTACPPFARLAKGELRDVQSQVLLFGLR